MLLHSHIKSVYLRRRVRLFQAYSNKPNKSLQHHDNSLCSRSSVEKKLQWICNFGQSLEDSCNELSKIKNIIQSTHPQTIKETAAQIMEMVKLAINFVPASKLSNILYYLCRRSYIFRIQLSGFVAKSWINTETVKTCQTKMKQKMAIIMTDLFIFGVYLTQNQFLSFVLPLVFQAKTSQFHNSYLNPDATFQLHYISHFAGILLQPQIFLERNRNKVLNVFYQCLKQIGEDGGGWLKVKIQGSLRSLQQLYVLEPESGKVEQKQNEYIEQVRKYSKQTSELVDAIEIVIYSIQTILHLSPNSPTLVDFQQLLIKFNANCSSADTSNQNQPPSKDQTDQVQQQRSSDYSSTSTQIKQTPSERKTLQQIYNFCKHYKKGCFLTKDSLYTEPFSNSPNFIDFSPTGQVRFLEQLPESFIENLRSCSSLEASNHLVSVFLNQYNKYVNRVKIVTTIFKQLYDRININYIVRVLYGIFLVQREQISDLVSEQSTILQNKLNGRSTRRITNSQYGKYSNLVIQLIKFEFLNQRSFMLGLLEQIKSMNSVQPQISSNPVIPQGEGVSPKMKNQQKISLTQVMDLLEKLGRDTYYKSLETHILFNTIIKEVYLHINTKIVGYEVDTISRFNGLVHFLQNVKNQKQTTSSQSILPISQLKNDKSFNQVLKNLQRQLKDNSNDSNGKNGITRICGILAKSIPYQNYISTYLYAELVQHLNSKKLDEEIKKLTKDSIISNLQAKNYQGAANWGRFLGDLHRSNICKQNEFINFLDQVVKQYLSTHASATVKVICSAIESCSSYMKGTKKISEISQSLTFLLGLKKQLLKIGGLSNSILEQQVQQIMQQFHSGFKHITSVQQCIDLEVKVFLSSNVEKVMDNYQFQFQYKEKEQNQKIKEKAVNGYYCQSDVEQQDKKLRYAEKEAKSPKEPKQNSSQQTIFSKQIYELETNSSLVEKQSASRKQPTNAAEEFLPMPKKMKVVGRCRNGNKKIEKIQVTMI